MNKPELPDRVCVKCNQLAVIHDGYCGRCREVTMPVRNFTPKVSQPAVEVDTKTVHEWLLNFYGQVIYDLLDGVTMERILPIVGHLLKEKSALTKSNEELNSKVRVLTDNLRIEQLGRSNCDIVINQLRAGIRVMYSEAQYEALTKENQELRKYVHHLAGCGAYQVNNGKCTCELAQVLEGGK